MDNLWQLGNEFRGHSKGAEDHRWLAMSSKLAEITRNKGGHMNNFNYSRNPIETKSREKLGFEEDSIYENINTGLMNFDLKMNHAPDKSFFSKNMYNMNTGYQKNNSNSLSKSFKMNNGMDKYDNINISKDMNNNSNNVSDKRFKTLPSAEMLPRNEVLGGYIFVCNNDTMQEDLKRQLFGLPPRYRVQLLQDYLFFFTTILLINFMGYLRPLALVVLILTQLLGKTKSAKESLGFQHRYGSVQGRYAMLLKRILLGQSCIIMMGLNFDWNSPLLRPCRCWICVKKKVYEPSHQTQVIKFPGIFFNSLPLFVEAAH